MILIGLQNAEKKYEKTRHNAGAIVLAHLAKKNGNTFELDKYTNSFVEQGPTLLKIYLPNTFMNLSGESVQKILKKENSDFKNLYVFFDDVTIPVGQFKISKGEGASSHNGIKSVVEALEKIGLTKDDFTRVRIGVGKMVKDENGVEKLLVPSPDKLADFVLSNLNNLEISEIEKLGEKILPQLLITK